MTHSPTGEPSTGVLVEGTWAWRPGSEGENRLGSLFGPVEMGGDSLIVLIWAGRGVSGTRICLFQTISAGRGYGGNS